MRHTIQNCRKVALGIVAVACGISLIACSPVSKTDVNFSAKDVSAAETAQPSITFEGNPPNWAETATTVMSDLEEWRNLSFNSDLQVTFQPVEDANLSGWYDSATKQLVVSTTSRSETFGRGVLLHEIFHALQDQNFDLYQLRLQSLENPDADRALSAIIEGEAMLAVSELMNYDFLAHAKLPLEGDIEESLFENIFLYGAGLKFIQAVREDGGWTAVNQVFQSPPQATTLILNPEQYLAGERQAQAIAIPLEAGETLQSERTRGEYEVQWLVAQQAETRPLLAQIDAGYVGDRLGIVSTDNTTVHRWVIEFQDADIAEALVEGFRTALSAEASGQKTITTAQNSIVVEW